MRPRPNRDRLPREIALWLLLLIRHRGEEVPKEYRLVLRVKAGTLPGRRPGVAGVETVQVLRFSRCPFSSKQKKKNPFTFQMPPKQPTYSQ